MAELEDKLNAILGNPEAMGQIMSIARSLSDPEASAASGDQSGCQEGRQADPPARGDPAGDAGGQTPHSEDVADLLAGLTGRSRAEDRSAGGDNPLSALDSLDPRLIQLGLRLFSAYSAGDDRRTALLSALKPFLKEERQAKLEKAIQLAKLSRVIRVAFQVFKKEGGEAEV